MTRDPKSGPQSLGRYAAGTSDERIAPRPVPSVQGFEQPARRGGNGPPPQLIPEPRISGDSGTFIDRALRERVEADIAVFLTAFDAALQRIRPKAGPDYVRRLTAYCGLAQRTRIELERLEARAPLPRATVAKPYEPARWQR